LHFEHHRQPKAHRQKHCDCRSAWGCADFCPAIVPRQLHHPCFSDRSRSASPLVSRKSQTYQGRNLPPRIIKHWTYWKRNHRTRELTRTQYSRASAAALVRSFWPFKRPKLCVISHAVNLQSAASRLQSNLGPRGRNQCSFASVRLLVEINERDGNFSTFAM
jgi:hypothetical protein